MGFLHECPSCHKVCEQNICTRTDAKGYETELLECSGCKHTWFATHVITDQCGGGIGSDRRHGGHQMKCPKCGSEDLWLENGPELGLGGDEIVCLLWQCNECGARWIARYDLKLRNIEMMRNRNGTE